ncbi:uncharacterized protein A1O5_00606 [Cladophialophora psammophila CBS 110553]|uniref:DUF7587 domain-containing protein n=1 Tax=Cladophialophora psammophila CBS 110553 TaxID=1182543 RepID=W9X798_9EURO|nr:uncharacterized protein A1O5_00606 [Cladophialophora psammophila CBS 110553]EXJ76098.1 hypothetical protein A1O5_00606 [Cladophialophora psammophila CBS 110553]
MGAVSACTQGISRYLFRVWNDESAGENTEGHFKSEREKQGMCADLEVMSEVDIKESLLGHMANRKHNFRSPWISFATSPIWVFSKALGLFEEGRQNLRLAIIDTWNLGEGAHIFHTGALLKAYNVDQDMVYANMGEPMVLAWKQLRAPTTVIRLDEFLPSVLETGYLKPGYLRLQPFHYKPLDSEFANNLSAKGKNAANRRKKKPWSRLRKTWEIRQKTFPTQSTFAAFQETALEQQAPWRFQRRRFAGRMSQGKQPGRKTENFRAPMAPFQLDEYVEFLKREVKEIELQLPLLIALLSTRTAEVEYDSILDRIQELGRDDPMVRAHKQCIVRDCSSTDLPELTTFEKLFRDASERLGIPVVANPGLRKFWVLTSRHTEIPQLQEDSEKILDMVEARERRWARLKDEKARRKEAEEANANTCGEPEPRKRRKIQATSLLSEELKKLANESCRGLFYRQEAPEGQLSLANSAPWVFCAERL